MSLTSKLPGGRGTAVVLTTGLAAAAVWAASSNGPLTRAISTALGSKPAVVAPPAATVANRTQKGKVLTQADDTPRAYMVLFREKPLASYKGGVAGIAAPARVDGGRGRMDAKSASALEYVRYLEGRQRTYEGRMEQALGRSLQINKRWQHALNGVATIMSPLEAEAIARLPEVRLVEANRDYEVDTDVGPHLIGASNVWNGNFRPIDTRKAARGKGVVVGIIDTGINFGSPSFAATDPVDGYVHENPNGAGTYLGTCAPGGVDEGRCNDKLIGGWDFVCEAPGNACANPGYREEPGFGDTNGHGSHTASTAAGNNRHEFFNGTEVSMSGVAPRANIIAYDVCYTNITTGQGSCPGLSSASAVDQAVQDGVDVINFSIGGGVFPWNDVVSLAFLSAADAGIFVATSAGNSGPGASTLGHVEPWTTTSAASQHGRGAFAVIFDVTGPGTPPASTQDLQLTAGSGGEGNLQGAIPGTTPLVVSPNIDTPNDGCNAGTAYPAGTFQNGIAIVRRGSCNFSEKVNNAANAGAQIVIIANNAVGGISPSVPGTSVPVFAMTQAEANAVRDFANANTGETASLTPFVDTNTVDALADFSSRGPSGYDMVKPDITSPGVDILAAYASSLGLTGAEELLATISGTSMASPHTAGAAALLRQLHPTWSPLEIKSALQMTASETVLLEDGTTAADAHAAGSGRTQVDRAARAGLVLHETLANFEAADPDNGGDTTTLNLASMMSRTCETTCTFVRTVRSTLNRKQTWRASVSGVNATVSPKQFLLSPGQTQQITITIDNTNGPTDGSYSYARLQLASAAAMISDPTLPALHMPIVLRKPPTPVAIGNGEQVVISGATDSDRYFTFEVPANVATATVAMSGGTGDADLWVLHGAYPATDFDCRPYLSGNNETCTFNPATPGVYHIRVNAYSAYTGVTLTASYTTTP